MTGATLREMADRGQIDPQTPLRRGSSGPWRTAGDVKGLQFPASAPAPFSPSPAQAPPPPHPARHFPPAPAHGQTYSPPAPTGQHPGQIAAPAPGRAAAGEGDAADRNGRTENRIDFDPGDNGPRTRPRLLRRDGFLPGFACGAAAVGVLSLLVLAAANAAIGPDGGGVAGVLAAPARLFNPNPVREAVLEDLRLSLNDPDFEVVFWHAPIELTAADREKAAVCADRCKDLMSEEFGSLVRDGQGVDGLGGRVQRLAEGISFDLLDALHGTLPTGEPMTVQFLRYRANNGFGAKVVTDCYFLLVGGKVVASIEPAGVSLGEGFLNEVRADGEATGEPPQMLLTMFGLSDEPPADPTDAG